MVTNLGFGTQPGENPGTGGGSGPPFALNSAEWGLSVDAGTLRIVLGNDVTGVPGPAQLAISREIWDNGNLLFFTNTGVQAAINSLSLSFTDSVNALTGVLRANLLTMTDSGAGTVTNVQAAGITAADSVNNVNSGLQPGLLAITDGGTGDFVNLNPQIFQMANAAPSLHMTLQPSVMHFLPAAGASDTFLSLNDLEMTNGVNNCQLTNSILFFAGGGFSSQLQSNDMFVNGGGMQSHIRNNTVFTTDTGTGAITSLTPGGINIQTLQTFASNALALAGGLVIGDLYKNAVGVVSIVF